MGIGLNVIDETEDWDAIYLEMWKRNIEWLATHSAVPDPLLLLSDTTYTDYRRCIALVAGGTVHLHSHFKSFMSDLHRMCPSEHYKTPNLHHTFQIMRGWRPTEFDHDVEMLTLGGSLANLSSILSANLKPYTVTFDRVMPVKTGIVLVGTPSHNVNAVRQMLRDADQIEGEPYKIDICHVSVLRWTREITETQQKNLIDHLSTLPQVPYITMHVSKIDVTLASWMLYPGDGHRILHTIKL